MLTRRITTAFARNAVLDTTELLEKIILELPMEDILNSTKMVNKRWSCVIICSKSIQRKLFLYPEPQTNGWVFDTKTRELRRK